MVTVTTFTEAGGHEVNEDAFMAFPHPADPDCWLCFLADGQGGRAGGAEAANLACRAAADAAVRSSPANLGRPTSWDAVLAEADRAVEAEPLAGFSTFVGFSIRGGYMTGASCGDSAVLAVIGGTAVEVTSNQRKNPPVGSGAAAFTPFAARLTAPWVVLAMTDGVWKYAGWDRVARAAMERRGGARRSLRR